MPPAVQNILSASLPLPVVVVLILNASLLTWWTADKYSNLDARVASIERAYAALANHEARIIVTEQAQIRIREDLAEIKVMLRDKAQQGALDIAPQQ